MFIFNGVEYAPEKFPNGELKVNTPDVFTDFNVTYKDWNGVEGFLDLLLFCHSFKPNNMRHSSRLYLPYLPYSRMDRCVDSQGFTLPVIADFINALNFDEVLIGEPHSDVSMALVKNSRRVNLTQALFDKFVKRVNTAVVLPDAGATKRYKIGTAWPMGEGRKKRDEGTGKLSGFSVTLDDRARKCDHFVITDDLCSRGGTFVGIVDALEKELGRKPEITLITAHTEYAFFDGKIPRDDRFVSVYTTDAMLDPMNLHARWKCDKLTVLDSASFL